MNSITRRSSGIRGFTLVELAIVLVIITLLSGGLIMSLSAQQETAAIADTQRRLNDVRDALLGYAAANGRLPCPAAPNSTGAESPAGGGICTNPWDGFLPAITLGIGPTDANGYALDSWGNPIRYALTTFQNPNCLSGSTASHCYATANGVKAVWNGVGSSALAPDLQVCSTAACASGTTLTSNAVAVIFSRGKNGGATPTSPDEIANGDSDRLFVSHTPTTAAGNEFDDLLIWLSPNILYNRLITAGRLP